MFKKLLIPLDKSALAELALNTGCAIANACGASVDLVMVHLPVLFTELQSPAFEAERRQSESGYLQSTATELVSKVKTSVSQILLDGDPAEMICARARDVGADLIVMTTHGRTGFSRAWLGSVADGVIRKSAIPVLTLRQAVPDASSVPAPHLFRRILVPIDGSVESRQILDAAYALAQCGGAARIILLRIVQPATSMLFSAGVAFGTLPEDTETEHMAASAKLNVDEVAEDLAARGGIEVMTRVLVAPNVAHAILDFAIGNDIDAIAMSTRGRGASRLLVGSVADKVLRASEVPVMLQHPVTPK